MFQRRDTPASSTVMSYGRRRLRADREKPEGTKTPETPDEKRKARTRGRRQGVTTVLQGNPRLG